MNVSKRFAKLSNYSMRLHSKYLGESAGAAASWEFELLESRRMLSGTWQTIATAVPASDGAQNAVVLGNGTIMVHGGKDSASNQYYDLAPVNGSYINGSWTTLAAAPTDRLFDATEVLQSGKVMVLGGEYSGSNTADTFINTGEIYNPVTNTWAVMPTFPQSNFGDDPTEMLPNGTVLAGYISGAQTYIYNPITNAWSPTGTKLRSDQSDEEAWVTLPDGSILSYDVFSSVSTGVAHSQRYIPSSGTWVDAGILPAQLSSAAVGYELGPGMLLPDGRVFYTGATAATAYYTESSNSWTAGPTITFSGTKYVSADAPGAILPDGDVLLVMSPLGGSVSGGYNFPSPSIVVELNPTTNAYTAVTPTNFNMNLPSFTETLVVLPTGQVALMNESGSIDVFTETGTPVAAATPVITGITYTGTAGVYTLSGTNLNGINEGAAYGDDNEMSSNYPLVRLTDGNGNVTYATTSNWSKTGVDQGAETVTVTLPTSTVATDYELQAVANGVASTAILAVLVSPTLPSPVTVAQSAGNSAYVGVTSNGNIEGYFAVSSFSTIDILGDNSGDTINVNLNSGSGSTVTTVQAGTAADTINVYQTSPTGSVVIAPSTGTDAVNVGTVGYGTAIAQFVAAQQIGVLTIGSGGKATIANTGVKKLLQTNGVVTSGTGLLDITNNDMIVHTGNVGTLTSEISTAFNSPAGFWNGPGITSSVAAASTSHLMAIGIILNNNAGSTIYGNGAPLGLFDSQSPSITDVLIKYTYFGDANLDGHVDGSDYTKIDNGFNNNLTGWLNGDFDYNGSVNGSDYSLIDNAFNTQGASIASQIASAASTLVSGASTATAASALVTSASNKSTAIGLSGWTAFADPSSNKKDDAALATVAKASLASGLFNFGDTQIA